MKNPLKTYSYIVSLWLCFATAVCAAGLEPVWSLAQKEKPALMNTLKELVAIESGSREPEELDKIANVLAARLKALGGKVESCLSGCHTHLLDVVGRDFLA